MRFDESLIQTEFSPTERCGYFHFTFPSGNASVVLANRLSGDLRMQDGAITGEENFDGMKAYVYGEFSVPVTSKSEAFKEGKQLTATIAQHEVSRLSLRHFLHQRGAGKARISGHEIPAWGFATMKDAARARWNKALGQIAVEGGTEAQRRVFYTALYRCFERMINITEDGRYYSGFDHQVHTDARPFYVDNWLWDTYRALEPLHHAAQS